MAIGIFRSLEFGGINSADYDVYITGEGVYDAPERSAESVSVPGRNGAILIDNGHFENIEVKYNAGVTGSDQAEFARKISDFRNAILSQKGYQRLTDEYNPSEYRMASYVSGLEVEATEGEQGTVGEFELVFNCKPQRFLTSGETPVTVSSGDTIDNPTLFDSQPVIEVEGDGNFSVNGYSMSLVDKPIGTVTFSKIDETIDYYDSSISGLNKVLNQGDSISLDWIRSGFYYTSQGYNLKSVVTTISADGFGNVSVVNSYPDLKTADMTLDFSGYTTTYETKTVSVNFSITTTDKNDAVATATGSVTMNIDTAAGTITWATVLNVPVGFVLGDAYTNLTDATAYSTKSSLGHVYIDCELGEAYKIESGEVISLNNFFTLGANLPVLSPGANTVTYDNTITLFRVTPRWWKI